MFPQPRSEPQIVVTVASSSTGNVNLGAPQSEKLTKSNFPMWRAQILPAIHGA
jgi:hypothetical protein